MWCPEIRPAIMLHALQHPCRKCCSLWEMTYSAALEELIEGLVPPVVPMQSKHFAVWLTLPFQSQK